MWEALLVGSKYAWNDVKHTFGQWNIIDWCFLICLLICLVWGAIRGLRSQLLSLFGYVVAFVVAARNYEYLIPWVRKRVMTNNQEGATGWNMVDQGTVDTPDGLHAVLAFCILFLFILLGLWLLKQLLNKLSGVRPIRSIDRVIGAVLGIGQFMCIWSIAYILMMSWPTGKIHTLASQSYWIAKTDSWLPVWFAEALQWIQWL